MNEIELYKALKLPNGIPAYDTFGHVFVLLDPTEFEQTFGQWVRFMRETLNLQIIALDGENLRRSHDQAPVKARFTKAGQSRRARVSASSPFLAVVTTWLSCPSRYLRLRRASASSSTPRILVTIVAYRPSPLIIT
jgi:hypothetical protein